jgi:hypothetical protein
VNRQAVDRLLRGVLALHPCGDVVIEEVGERLRFAGVKSSSVRTPAVALA